MITDDCDDEGSCGVLNIFVQTEEQRVRTRKQLNLTGPPVEEGDDYETYKVDGLSVSIVEM